MIGDDLFPRDFIYSLAPPTNYIGADKIFGDATEKFSDVLIPLRREEMDLFFPFTHKKTLEVDALPPSSQPTKSNWNSPTRPQLMPPTINKIRQIL